jgi:hypothetical protein
MRCNNVLVLSTPLLQVTDSSAAEGWMSEHAMKRERENLAGRVLEQRATRIMIQLWPRISVLFRPLARHCVYKSPARGSGSYSLWQTNRACISQQRDFPSLISVQQQE